MSSKVLNSKNLLLACTFAMASMSFTAFSQETSLVCADPLKKICLDTKAQRAQREVYINKLKSEIAVEAAKKAAPRIEAMKKEVSRIQFIKRMVRSYKIRNQEIMNAAKKRVVGIESVITDKANVELLKGYMKEAIDQTNFNDTTKGNFKSTIDTIVIGNFGDFLEKSGLEDNVMAQLLNNACGSDGLVSNAFATTLNKERYVLICPGFLITLTQTPDLRDRFNSILQVISHEMGHHIDNSQAGLEAYKPFLSCISDNYGSTLNKTSADEKFCKKKAESKQECNMQVTVSHGGELVADAWGLKVLNIHARKQNYTVAETDVLLTNSWTNLCDSGDEGIHPSGDFRIGTLLRTQPDITDYLACDNSSVNSKPACTFEGETHI
jgi:hypothetical protein